MSIRTIPQTSSLASVWEELVYTEARVTHDSHAKSHAKDVVALIERCEAIEAEQRKCWRAEIVAQAAVDAQDLALDAVVDDIDDALLAAVDNDRAHARYKRYFTRPRSEIVRLGLESETARVTGWPASLATEDEKTLKDAGRALAHTLEAGTAALDSRRKAIGSTADHRARQIVRLIDDVNAMRLSIYAALLKSSVNLGMPRDWAASFFRHYDRGAKNPSDAQTTADTEPTTAPATPATK